MRTGPSSATHSNETGTSVWLLESEAMPAITAILHTENDALRLGRALEMLLPCAEILVVDHNSRDATRQVAGQYGARVVSATDYPVNHYLALAANDWILCLQPNESISDRLQATLYEWVVRAGDNPSAPFSVLTREETFEGWRNHPTAETRLIPRDWNRWQGRIPASDPSAAVLEGELLRFSLP
jgi:glycosyltransferase involved in cell wall biosynthesis